ncbi:hypothetical protein FQN54_005422 [Arachnomyces sp. PD_36]|nr:hypothetical protein FQN54_005422 [Arachnomyces sp. PD_36]
MVLAPLSFLARLGALGSSVIVLGLGAKFISNRAWSVEFLIYIEAIAVLSILGSLIPPYPNFLYDSVWAAAWLLAAVFALVVQVFESDCYGFRPDGDVNCATYRAGVVFDIGQFDQPVYVGYREEDGKQIQGTKSKKERERELKGLGNSHIARYFICYGFVGVVLLAVGIPVLILYAGPAFGIYLIGSVPLPVLNGYLSNPDANSMSVSITSEIRIPDRLQVSLDPFRVSFFLEDTKEDPVIIGEMDLPFLTFKSNERIIIDDQRMTIVNFEEFARLILDVGHKPKIRIAGMSRTKVHAGPIHTWMDIYKVIELDAFDNFPTLDVPTLAIQQPDDERHNIYGELTVYNPSTVSATLANVTIAISIGDVVAGEALAIIDDLVPGNNTFPVYAKLDTPSIEGNITTILETELPYLRQELLMATATGLKVVNNGVRVTYLEQAFQQLHVTAIRPVKPLLQGIVDSGVTLLTGEDRPNEFLGSVVDRLLDLILKTIKDLEKAEVDNYTEALGKVATLALRLLSLLGLA